MLTKICKCGKIYKAGEHCSCYSKRHAIYDKHYRNKESAAVYHSKEWAVLTQLCKDRCNGIDLYKLMTSGHLSMPKQGVCHHIIEVIEAPELRYDINNLVYVSYDSHNNIHNIYKGKGKADLQRKLKKFLDTFVAAGRG